MRPLGAPTAVVVGVLAASLLAGEAVASTWTVPSVDAPDLAAALALASDGDEIRVSPRHEPRGARLLVLRSVTLRGDGGEARLPPLELARGAWVRVEDAVFSALPEVEAAGSDPCAGAALCVRGATAQLDRVALDGVGAAVLGGTLLATDTAWRGAPGPALRAASGWLTLVRPTFVEAEGGAVLAVDTAVGLSGGLFADNEGPDPGVDLRVEGGSLAVEGTAFTGSEGSSVAAIDAPVALVDVSFTAIRAREGGALWASAARPVAVVVDGLAAADVIAEGDGGLLWLRGVHAGIVGVEASGVRAGGDGGLVAVRGGRVELLASAASDVAAPAGSGGLVFAEDAVVLLEDVSLTAGPGVTAGKGGLVAARASDLSLDGVAVDGARVSWSGGAVYGTGGALSARDLVVRDARAGDRGGAIAWSEGELAVRGFELRGCRAGRGGAIAASGVDTLVLEDGSLRDNIADARGAALLVEGPVRGAVRRVRACGNRGAEGGVLALDGFGAGDFTVENSALLANVAPAGLSAAGGAGAGGGEWLELRNNAFAGNETPGGAVRVEGVAFHLVNNAFVDNALGLAVPRAGRAASGGYNLWHANGGGVAAGWPAATDLAAAPAFAAYAPGDCDAVLWLAPGSPLRDAGDPALPDPDGSRSDIGAYGGPGALIPDADGDGVGADLDCDEGDPDTFPGAVDLPYDGVDQDCDGADRCDVDGDGVDAMECGGPDCADDDAAIAPGRPDAPYDGVDQDCDGADLDDVDGDGWVAIAAGGADCDDGDASVHPGAVEIPNDGTDQDCDGLDRTALLIGGGGCDSGAGAGPWWLALLLLLRRRRGR